MIIMVIGWLGVQGPAQLAWAAVCAAPVTLLLGAMLTVLPAFVMEHMSLAGARGPMWGGDAAAGAVVGFGSVATAGFLAALLADRLGRQLKASSLPRANLAFRTFYVAGWKAITSTCRM